MASGLAVMGGGAGVGGGVGVGVGVVAPGDARACAEPASTSSTELADPLAALHLAAVDGDLTVIRGTVARHPALLDSYDARGMTPLALAAWHDHAGIVEYLIDAGADVDRHNANGLTPLFSAIDRGRTGTARILIDAGADLFVTGFRDRNLLHMTARVGDTELARLLVEAGVPLNARDARGARPLTIAVARSHVDVTAYLLDQGAVMNDVEMTQRLREALHDRPGGVSISEYLGEADVITVDIYKPEKHRKNKQDKKVARIRARE
jgi:ankyrin repeat protein